MPSGAASVRESLRGVSVGLLTPFDEDDKIDHEKVRENARALSKAGAETFLATANISEYHSLSRAERIDLTATCVDSLPSTACVLAGAGGNTRDAQELIREYDRIGVDAIMVMPPDHTYLHEQGLLEYYRKLAAASDKPLVPYLRGFEPSVDYLAALTELDAVVGIKYALEDHVTLGAAISAGDDSVVWVNGLAEPHAVAYWAEGVEGFTAGVSNFRPEVGLELFDALVAGNWERARELRNICLPFQNFRSESGTDNTLPGAVSVAAVKMGLDLAGLHGGRVREPIRPLSPEDEERAVALYERLDEDIDRLVG